MKLPPVQFHLARGGTAPASRRASQRLAADVNNTASKLVNPASGTPVGAHACRVYNPTPTSYTDNTLTAVTWGTESLDIDNWHDNATNPGRITVTQKGIYLVQAAMLLPGGIVGPTATTWPARFSLLKNGVSQGSFYGLGTQNDAIQVAFSTLISLANGDYLTVSFLQHSGFTAVVPTVGEYDSFFSVALLGTN